MAVQELTESDHRDSIETSVSELVARARAAQLEYESFTQSEVDSVVTAIAWAIYEPNRARRLAELAVESTGMGNISDKFDKNRRKTVGTLADLIGARSVGEIRRDDDAGIVEYAKPMGVVAAICPSTNAAAAPANIAMHIVKGRNAVIISPSPRALSPCRALIGYIKAELRALGAPTDLVQLLEPVTKARSDELVRLSDFAVVTGSEANVRSAYRSGTPVSGVGRGNPQIIVCRDADISAAADKIAGSKTFDNGISCSSESGLHIHRSIYRDVIAALSLRGGQLLDTVDARRLRDAMWSNGSLNRALVGKSASELMAAAGISSDEATKFLMVEQSEYGAAHPFSGEKMSPIVSLYSFESMDEVLYRVQEILDFQGAGHSCGIHTSSAENAERVAAALKVARVILNQPHVIGNSGSYDNGLECTLSVGGGSWAGNSTCDNINYRHFMNYTRLVHTIAATAPNEALLFDRYLGAEGLNQMISV
ncbi:acylating sulfoacetaldehyde dehydrogenase [Nocardia nepalensis]|uniref:acylating sulfoacetaldehyde dehydrogenase n=1 Tax=Nocardia nepalensis TaxID=3375448 RepID=UPI003B67DA75